MKKQSCLLSDKVPQKNHVPLYFIMMVLLLLYIPKHTKKNLTKKKITPSYNCNLSATIPKKFFLHTLNQIRKKSKRNVFVLTEVPKRQLLLQENKQNRNEKSERNPGKKKIPMKYTHK